MRKWENTSRVSDEFRLKKAIFIKFACYVEKFMYKVLFQNSDLFCLVEDSLNY